MKASRGRARHRRPLERLTSRRATPGPGPAADAADLAAIGGRDEQNGYGPAARRGAPKTRRAPRGAAAPVVKLRAAAYNVWFGTRTRLPSTAVIARSAAADVVGFQEVTDDSFPFEAALKRGFQAS